MGSLRDREVARARPQTARARISNPVSGGQCHLNHLTILRRFSRPSLAYLCTKVAQSPIHFIYISTTQSRPTDWLLPNTTMMRIAIESEFDSVFMEMRLPSDQLTDTLSPAHYSYFLAGNRRKNLVVSVKVWSYQRR